MNPPNKRPESGPLRDVYRAINDLRDYVMSLRIMNTPTVRATHTSQGTLLQAAPNSEGGDEVEVSVCDSYGVPKTYMLVGRDVTPE